MSLAAYLDGLDDFGAVGWLTAVLSVAAAAVWVRFVRQLTNRHKLLTNER